MVKTWRAWWVDRAWWVAAGAVAAVLGSCGSGGGAGENVSATGAMGPVTRMQQAIGANRPVMMVDGEAAGWGKLLPMVVDSPAGEMASRLVVLEIAARRELQQKHGVVFDQEGNRLIVEAERSRLMAEIAAWDEEGVAGRDAAQRVMIEAARARGLGLVAMEQSLLVRGLIREVVKREGLGLASVDEAAKLRLIAAERLRRDGAQVDVAIAVFENDASAQRGMQRLSEAARESEATAGRLRIVAMDAGARVWLVVRGLSIRDPRMPAGMQQTIDSIEDGEVGGLVPLSGFDPASLDPTFADGGGLSNIKGTAVVYRLTTRRGTRPAVSNEVLWREISEQDQSQRIDARIAAMLQAADVIIYDRDLQRAWERQKAR